MTQAFDVKMSETVQDQIEARQQALAEIDRAKFGWYHVRYGQLTRISRGRELIS
jgi:hypothetical protein